MRRALSGRQTPAIVVGIVVVLIAGGSYAVAKSGSNKPKTISACVKKDGGTYYKTPCKRHDKKVTWNQKGQKGDNGATGATGAIGATGATGATGADGFVQIASWQGGIGTITANNPNYVFAGPTSSLTTTDSQSIAASGSAALGAAAPASVRVTVCKQPSTGGDLTPLASSSSVYEGVTVQTTRLTFAISEAGAPGAGTWNIGMCVRDNTAQAVDNNDWSIGYAFVTNSTLVATGLSKAVAKHAK
jgi:hypothetical protein